MQLMKLDNRRPDLSQDEILCFTGIRNEIERLPYFLEYHRNLGVDRFFFIDNCSDDGTTDYLLDQNDCHCFQAEGSHFEQNIWPPNWSNALLNVFGDGHWCVVVDSDELLVYPECEAVSLTQFCRFLQVSDANAMAAYMIDMYGDGPIADGVYQKGDCFMNAAPFFDPKPGWLRPFNGYPPQQMFGGVRERVFWYGRFKKALPPCISKVPLVDWRRGMRYLVAQHTINFANLTPVTGALLHFKFLTGFQSKTVSRIEENRELKEKTLEEMESYIEALKRDPNLSLWNEESIRYENSNQLIELGWISGSAQYDDFLGNPGKP